MARPVLNYKFSGDPLKLEAFIADAELVESLTTGAAQPIKDLCLKFVKSNLEGGALEALPEEVASEEKSLV